MARVYIVNRGGHDHSDAERFGKLIYLSEGPMNKYGVTQIYRQFAIVLANSSPEDYILPTGLSIMGHIACSIFVFLHGRLNLLLYKPSTKVYVERTVKIDELIKRKKGRKRNFRKERENGKVFNS
jgi:hypothetical protein